MGLTKPARSQLNKWQKAGTNGVCEIIDTQVNGEEGIYKVSFKYMGKKVDMIIDFSKSYPTQAPSMKFTTKMYHVGIGEDGAICEHAIAWEPNASPQRAIEHVRNLLDNHEQSVAANFNPAACLQYNDD